MANDKRNDRREEKKAGAATAQAATAPAAAEGHRAGEQTKLVRLPVAIPPDLQDPQALDVRAAEALAGLHALISDDGLSVEAREKVQALIAEANPEKPGLEENDTPWSVTRLHICQPTSQSAARPATAQLGDIYSDVGTIFKRPFEFIPLYFHQENVYFEPTPPFDVVCRSPDAKLGSRPPLLDADGKVEFGACAGCKHLPFGKQLVPFEDQQMTECQNQIVVLALSADLSGIFLVTFHKTSFSAGRELKKLAAKGPFVWKRSYLLDTEKGNSDRGVYATYKVSPTGKDSCTDTIKIAVALSKLYEANRKKTLAECYRRFSSTPTSAPEIEKGVDVAQLKAGLELGALTSATGSM